MNNRFFAPCSVQVFTKVPRFSDSPGGENSTPVLYILRLFPFDPGLYASEHPGIRRERVHYAHIVRLTCVQAQHFSFERTENLAATLDRAAVSHKNAAGPGSRVGVHVLDHVKDADALAGRSAERVPGLFDVDLGAHASDTLTRPGAKRYGQPLYGAAQLGVHHRRTVAVKEVILLECRLALRGHLCLYPYAAGLVKMLGKYIHAAVAGKVHKQASYGPRPAHLCHGLRGLGIHALRELAEEGVKSRLVLEHYLPA